METLSVISLHIVRKKDRDYRNWKITILYAGTFGETEKAEKQMEKAAMELHEVREQNAVKFAEEIVHQMSELNFLDAWFEIRLTEAKVILHKEKMMQSFICRLIRENLCVHWGCRIRRRAIPYYACNQDCTCR